MMLFTVSSYAKGWEESDRGWVYRNKNGNLKSGFCRHLDDEPYSFFFWPDGSHSYCTEDGSVGAPNTLAWGRPNIVIFKRMGNGNLVPKYMADEQGHLVSNVEYEYNSTVYRFSDSGSTKVVRKNRQSSGNSSGGNSSGSDVASLHVPQGDNVSCTAASCAMMLRSRARRDGSSGWQNITLGSVKDRFWTSNGMAWSGQYPFEGGTYFVNSDPSSIKNSQYGSGAGQARYDHITTLLRQHPEGIVAYFYDAQNYRKSHAVFVTKVKNGNIYCLDPYDSAREIQIENSSTFRSNFGYGSQDQLLRLDNTVDGRFFCWYIE